jgi:hypothetical protein
MSAIYRWACITLVVLAVAAGMLAMHFRGSLAVSRARVAVAEQRADQLDDALKASEKARAAEHAQAMKFQGIADNYLQEKADAQAAADRTIADLRAGTVRLRAAWRCPGDTGTTAAAGASQPDAAAELRRQGAADLVRNADEADAQIRGLQAILKAERQP